MEFRPASIADSPEAILEVRFFKKVLTESSNAIAMIAVAVAQYPALLSQPGARTFVAEPICVLIVYAVAIFCFAERRGATWDTILPTAVTFGLLTGTCEIVNMGIENGIPFSVHGPILQIGSMLTIYVMG